MSNYRRYLIPVAQAVVSVALLAWIATRVDLTDSFASVAAVPVWVLVMVSGMMGATFFAAAARWGRALQNFSIRLSSWRLFSYYLMGLFFSLFLPTSVGGDAFRVYAVARACGRPAAVLFATLQERLVGLCGAVTVSLAVMPIMAHILPPEIRPAILAVQGATVVVAVFVLYPPLVFSLLGPLLRALRGLARSLPRLHSDFMAARIERVVEGLENLVRTRPTRVTEMLALGLLPAIIVSLAYREILSSMGISVPVAFFMLIIPLVWIIRLLPISLGGIGLGEGAFVVLAALGGIDQEKAFAAAVLVLAIQIAWSMLGGALLLQSGLKRTLALSRRT